MKAIAVKACGHVGLLKEDQSTDTWYFEGYRPAVARRVFSKQLPNPLEGQYWETDGITDILVPQRELFTDENGKYCFVVKKGLWLVWPDVSDEEKMEGFVFTQVEHRAFITDTGIVSLSFFSAYLEISG